MTQYYTRQEAFDIALNHIRKQNGPAFSEGLGCLYRTEDGMSCAFAPFIINYDSKLENVPANRLVQDSDGTFDGKIDSKVNPAHASFYADLQRCHDDAADGFIAGEDEEWFMEQYEKFMSQLAHYAGISYEKPTSN